MITRKYHPLYTPETIDRSEAPKSPEASRDKNSLLQFVTDLQQQAEKSILDNSRRLESSSLSAEDKTNLQNKLSQLGNISKQLAGFLKTIQQLPEGSLTITEFKKYKTPLQTLATSIARLNPETAEGIQQLVKKADDAIANLNNGIQNSVSQSLAPQNSDTSEVVQPPKVETTQSPDIGAFFNDLVGNAQNMANNVGKTIQSGVEGIFATPAKTEASSTEPEAAISTQTTSPAESKEKQSTSIQLPSEIFAASLPQPRPAGENLLLELNKLSNAKSVEQMAKVSDSIKASIDKAIVDLAGLLETAQNKEGIVNLSSKLNALSDMLGNGTITAEAGKPTLFDGIYNALVFGDGYIKEAQAYLAKSASTPEQKTEVSSAKEFQNMSAAERQEAITAISYRLMGLKDLKAEVGAKPAELSKDNLAEGVYVGDLYRLNSGGTERLPQDYFVASRYNLINPNTIQKTGNNTFTYRENDTIYTVEVRSSEGVQTRKIELPADMTKMLSSLTRLPEAEKKPYIDQINAVIQNQLGSRTFFSIQSSAGQMIIKTLPDKK